MTTLTKTKLAEEILKIFPFQTKSHFMKFEKKDLYSLYNEGVKLGKINPNITLTLNLDDLLMIRGTLRMLIEDESQELLNKEDGERLIKLLKVENDKL